MQQRCTQVSVCIAGAHRVLLQDGRAAGPPCPGARYGWFRCQEAGRVPGNICVPLCQPGRGAACVACTDADATCNAVRCLLTWADGVHWPARPQLFWPASDGEGASRRPGRRSTAHWAPTSG